MCNGENDDISASAPDLVAALNCDHEFVTFTAAEGAGDHCESGARTLFHARAFDWLNSCSSALKHQSRDGAKSLGGGVGLDTGTSVDHQQDRGEQRYDVAGDGPHVVGRSVVVRLPFIM